MPKEACRLLTLTVSLFGIICMAKGLSTRKESTINKSIYYNKDRTSNGVFYDGNELDSENEYIRKKKFALQGENRLESNSQNINEKTENIIPINNLNQLQPEAVIKDQLIENTRENFVDKSEYNIKSIKKRKNNGGNFENKRKNPFSYLHINHNKKYSEPEIYIINPDNFNKDVIRRLTRAEKKYELPMCDINENQENIHASSMIARSNPQKRALNTNNKLSISKMNINHNLQRRVRSQWRFRDHNNDLEMKNNQYKSQAKYKQNNISEKRSEVNTSDLDNEKGLSQQISHDDSHSENYMMKRGTVNEKTEMASIVACKKQQTPSKKEKNKEKKDEIWNKSTGNTSTNSSNQYDNKDSLVPVEPNNMNNNLSSSVTNISEQPTIVQNQELSDQTQISSTNQSMPSVSKENTEDISSAQKVKTEYETQEIQQQIQPNFTNNDFEHSEKNKIQMLNNQAPSIQAPSIQAPSIQAPSIQAPLIQAPSVQAPSVQAPSVQAPLIQAPLMQAPSIQTPLTLPNGVVPNVSYVYIQPLPFGNSMFLNQPKPVESSSVSNKKIDAVVNTENKSNDLITISIDPKTLQNKILHAEFLKKSDVKKTPETLSIELSPKEVSTNSSKHQKTVLKPLKISTSVKNNSIFITGGEAIGYRTTIPNEKKNQQQSLNKNFGEQELKKEPFNRQIKSISSPINMNDNFNDDKSLHENYLQNGINFIDKEKTDGTKVLIINAKQKEVCATEEPCKLLSTYCSIDLCGSDIHCKRTTWNLQSFKEIHEIGCTDENSTKWGQIENKTVSLSTNYEPMAIPTLNPIHFGNKIKREVDQMNISKIINLLKPVVVLSPKVDNEGSEDESGDSTGLIDKVNLKGSSEIAFEKGNKKVENKILEGFINSIIANYSKDEVKPLMKETTEKTEDGAEALLKLLENSMPKRNERDKEFSNRKKPDIWNLTPILVPESSLSKYGDSSEYAKLGPFDENFIKSFLKKEYISSLYRKKK
ncbi:putative leucine-rich repeat-containing protein DDB_G0290503 [Halyomorpha halys]|uniref:putative leucine-rich repeat-containing protein DDB_G0290503 n=1 Tax=Halyomorpha halys TaxID=286706 RepID=UPI0034D29FD8